MLARSIARPRAGLRFEDNYWGERDNGFDVILNRMRSGKQTCKDIIEIVEAHAVLEEDYARKLAKLAKMAVGKVSKQRERERVRGKASAGRKRVERDLGISSTALFETRQRSAARF